MKTEVFRTERYIFHSDKTVTLNESYRWYDAKRASEDKNPVVKWGLQKGRLLIYSKKGHSMKMSDKESYDFRNAALPKMLCDLILSEN